MVDTEECIHGLAPEWCALCKGTVEIRKIQAVRLGQLGSELVEPPESSRPQADPAERIAVMVASGVLCPDCMTMTRDRGCACSRQRLYGSDMADAAEWCSSDLAKSGFSLKELSGLVLSAQRRGSRYASLTPDESADERAGLLKEFDVEPRWHAVHRHEQNHLPI